MDTTSQPVATEKKTEQYRIDLSAVAIAIALAAGVGLYGWGKQQAVNQPPPATASLTN
ncbi:hypothetical protein ACLK17_23670 [Escherichia coli]